MIAITTVATALGIYVAGLRPNRVWIDDDEREVQLQTVAGRRTGSVLRAALPGHLSALGDFVFHKGKRLAIIGLAHSSNAEIGAGLYAFDADVDLTPDGVVWHDSILAEQIPPPPAGRFYPPESFNVQDCLLMDVFAEIDGSELVTAWGHDTFSWGALRIYDLDGNLLYQLWHDGPVLLMHTQWLSKPGLLVISSVYCTHDPHLISRELPKELITVPVVFAIRPQLGQLDTKLISVPERPEWWSRSLGRDTASGSRTTPEWYKFVWPLHRQYSVHPTASAHSIQLSPNRRSESHAHVTMSMAAPSGADLGGCFWTIDQNGNAVSTTAGSDVYRQSRDVQGLDIPAPSQFRLVDLDTLVADPFGDIADRATADGAPANGSAAGRTSPERPHSADEY